MKIIANFSGDGGVRGEGRLLGGGRSEGERGVAGGEAGVCQLLQIHST